MDRIQPKPEEDLNRKRAWQKAYRTAAVAGIMTAGAASTLFLVDNDIECDWREVVVDAGDTVDSISGGSKRGDETARQNPDVIIPNQHLHEGDVIKVCLPPEDGR